MISFSSRSIYLSCIVYYIFLNNLFSQNVDITGAVTDNNGESLKKAQISLRNLKDEVLAETTSNRKGKFSFEDIEPNFYYILFKHELKEVKRIKLNPRKTRNRDLILRIVLENKIEPVKCYLFDNKNPTDFDPILKVRNLTFDIEPGKVSFNWNDIRQANEYVLYENDVEIYRGKENRFDKDIYPGIEFCYKIQAFGNFNLEGEMSKDICLSAPTKPPRDIKVTTIKNSFNFDWGDVKGAKSYILFQNGSKIAKTQESKYLLKDLEFSKDYYFQIKAVDNLNGISEPSIEVKYTTHDFVEAPILSSIKDKSNTTLIWNEISLAQSYKIYRDDVLIDTVKNSFFVDNMLPGESYCYSISCLDKYGLESELSNVHCTKVALKIPSGVIADPDIESMHLNWNEVLGAISYNVYEKVNKDSIILKANVKNNQHTIKSLDYASDHCYLITAVDGDGEETDYSLPACNISFDPPNFKIQRVTLFEPSGNGILDAEEAASIQIALFNNGQSPAHNIIASILSETLDENLILGDPVTLDTLEAGRIKFLDFNIQALLPVKSGNNKIELILSSKEGILLDEKYMFDIETKSMIPPKMIIADYSISNDFGTHYVPLNEKVMLTLRIQNVGEGGTDFVNILVKENRSFITPGFKGIITLSNFNPGEFIDVQIPILSKENNFSIDLEITDYLGNTNPVRLDLETMRQYRSPANLTAQSIGTDNVDYYPDELGEVDVDRRVPLGRKNPNALAIILATEFYDDLNYKPLNYASRDSEVIRKYFKQTFGLSDFQLMPSKTWQMEGGPTGNDLINIFDPFQGDLRKRIITAEKYSSIEEVDIYLYYRGYGEWINGNPFLIPKDVKANRNVSKYSLEDLLENISTLCVLKNIKSVTIFLDITYINPQSSKDNTWNFKSLSEKISILKSSSNGENSQIYGDKKHSVFTYSLLKGLSGNADDGDRIIQLGELVDYVYRKVPEYSALIAGGKTQNPSFIGSDLNRIILDLK